MTGVNDEFTCAMCNETFTKARSDEEALAETAEIFGAESLNEPLDVVCDDCWRQMMGLPPADEDVEAALEQRDLP